MEHQTMTVEEFDKWIYLPENIELDYEYIGGIAYHILAPPQNSALAATFGAWICRFVIEKDIGHVTGANGAYKVANERYMPDIGYISYSRMPELSSEDAYVPTAPDLAVEVISPTDATSRVAIKLGNYLAEGTTVWIVDPEKEEVSVYVPNERVKTYKKTDTLDGGKVLQGFSLPLQKLFP